MFVAKNHRFFIKRKYNFFYILLEKHLCFSKKCYYYNTNLLRTKLIKIKLKCFIIKTLHYKKYILQAKKLISLSYIVIIKMPQKYLITRNIIYN